MIKQALESLLRSNSSFRGHGGFSAAISGILSDCITRFDHSITTDFTRIFPGGPVALQGMSSAQIRHLLFQDRMHATTMSGGPAGSQDLTAVTRCLQGSTVIVTLTDPAKHNLWIANLGDSQTGNVGLKTGSSPFYLAFFHKRFFFFIFILVLASRTHAGDWSPTFVTAPHDGNNRSEVMRIRNQHPGEPECLLDNRIVGFLGPTRCEPICVFLFSFLCSHHRKFVYSSFDATHAPRVRLVRVRVPQLSAMHGSNCHPSFLSAFFSIFVESGTYSAPRPTSPALKAHHTYPTFPTSTTFRFRKARRRRRRRREDNNNRGTFF